MNVMNIFEPLPSRGTATAISNPTQPTPTATGTAFTLQKSGARPITFTGRQLGHISGRRPGSALWHELNLFQTDDGRFVADIRAFTRAGGAKDQFHVAVADTLDEAVCFLEDFDPRHDMLAGFDVNDPSLTAIELLVQAAALKYRIAEAVSQYRAVLATFLKELDAG